VTMAVRVVEVFDGVVEVFDGVVEVFDGVVKVFDEVTASSKRHRGVARSGAGTAGRRNGHRAAGLPAGSSIDCTITACWSGRT
jgi:hypothetical protein